MYDYFQLVIYKVCYALSSPDPADSLVRTYSYDLKAQDLSQLLVAHLIHSLKKSEISTSIREIITFLQIFVEAGFRVKDSVPIGTTLNIGYKILVGNTETFSSDLSLLVKMNIS